MVLNCQSLFPPASSSQRLHQISAFRGCESGSCSLRHITSRSVCWLEHLSISWIACNLSSMPLLGCCAIGENTTTSRPSSVMFYTGFQFPFELNSRSACWSTSRFKGQRLGICATIVRRRIRPLRGYDFDRRIIATFLLDGRRLGLVTEPSQLLAPDAGTSFLLLCVQPIRSILLKLDLKPTCSATLIPLLVDCKAPL